MNQQPQVLEKLQARQRLIEEMECRIVTFYELVCWKEVSDIIRCFNKKLQSIGRELFIRLYGHIIYKKEFTEETF